MRLWLRFIFRFDGMYTVCVVVVVVVSNNKSQQKTTFSLDYSFCTCTNHMQKNMCSPFHYVKSSINVMLCARCNATTSIDNNSTRRPWWFLAVFVMPNIEFTFELNSMQREFIRSIGMKCCRRNSWYLSHLINAILKFNDKNAFRKFQFEIG